eukprot:scaffold7926_cov147-Skeletonema_marinoi.AAC.6
MELVRDFASLLLAPYSTYSKSVRRLLNGRAAGDKKKPRHIPPRTITMIPFALSLELLHQDTSPDTASLAYGWINLWQMPEE